MFINPFFFKIRQLIKCHIYLFFILLPVISNKLDGGMLNQITKCVAEKLIKQGKSSLSASIRNLADSSESEKNL